MQTPEKGQKEISIIGTRDDISGHNPNMSTKNHGKAIHPAVANTRVSTNQQGRSDRLVIPFSGWQSQPHIISKKMRRMVSSGCRDMGGNEVS